MPYPWTPIPNSMENIFGDDHFCHLLFRELFYRVNRTDGHPFTDKRGKTIRLGVGQCIFGRNQYAKYMALGATNSGRVERALCKLQKVHKLIDRQASYDWTLVTILNYDSYFINRQANRQAIDRQQTGNRQAIDTSKKIRVLEEKRKDDTESHHFLEWFNGVTGRKYLPTRGRLEKIACRLKAFPLEELKRAAQNRMTDEWAMGKSEDGKVWGHDVDSLIRSDEKVDRWLNYQRKSVPVVPLAGEDVPF